MLSKVLEIIQIPGAQKIEIIRFSKAQFIHRKGLFAVGDLCLIIKSNIFISENRRKMLKIKRTSLTNGVVRPLSFLGKKSNCYAIKLDSLSKAYSSTESNLLQTINELVETSGIVRHWLLEDDVTSVRITDFEQYGFYYKNPVYSLISSR